MNYPEIHKFFEEATAKFPERTAVRAAGQAISYRVLNDAGDLLASELRGHPSFTPGSIMALNLPAGLPCITAMMAVLKAGGVFVPCDPALPENRRQLLLEKVNPLGFIDAGIRWSPGQNPPPSAVDSDACYVMFTSGSTGEPKAILGSHKGLSHFIQWEVREFGLDETVRIGQLAPPTFDVSLRDTFVPLSVGGTLCIPPLETRTRIDSLLDWLEAESITLMHCVPSLFRALLGQLERSAHASERLPHLRRILLAGEPLYGGDVVRWRTLMGERAELVNLYGPSETTLAKAFHRITELPADPARMIPVGKALPDTTILILRDGEECDVGEIGEVHIRTDFRSKGYLGDPQRTAESFIPNPIQRDSQEVLYRTGDMGRYGPDGTVTLIGRRDTQVKVNGVRIELAEIEQALLRFPPIEQAVVVAHNGADRETTLAAYFVARHALEDGDLRGFLATWIPESMHPSFFVQMDELPVNLHGKVVRRGLPPPAGLLYRARPFVAPSGEVEESLAAAWDEVLSIRSVSATHTFVELGGDSLKATQVLPRIAERLGVEMKLQDLFPRGTIRQLALLIDAQRRRERSAVAASVGDSR